MRANRTWIALAFSLALILGDSPEGLSGTEPSTTRLEHLEDLHARAEAVARLAKPSPTVTIPAGWFLMGSPPKSDTSSTLEAPHDDTEVPQRRIWLDAYTIDRDEVSLGNYLAGLLRTPRALPPDLAQLELLKELAEFASLLLGPGLPPDHILATWPALKVSWAEAEHYCQRIRKRLPTEAEWEKAARATKGRLFPWGQAAPDARRAIFGRRHKAVPPVVPVDSFKTGRSPYGLHHMAGNVAEWIQDWSGIDYYASMPDRNPPGPETGRDKVVRGGSWKSDPVMLRAATRGGASPEQRTTTIGFRCAKSIP